MPIVIGKNARERVIRGARKLAKLVSLTYGPVGNTVLIERFGGLLPTKDGYTVAHEVDFDDPLESMGAKILREACWEVNDQIGDGTTTTAILGEKIAFEGHKCVSAGADLRDFLNGLHAARDFALHVLGFYSFAADKREYLESVANISSNQDREIVNPLTQACLDVGKYGTVVIEDGKSVEVKYQLKEGMELESGYVSAYFVTDTKRMVVDLDGPLVALVHGGLSSASDVITMLEEASGFQDRPLLVIAHYIEAEALATMGLNTSKGVFSSCGIKCPGVGPDRKREILEDLAAMSGATVVDPALGMDVRNFKPEWLGAFRSAQVHKNKTLLSSYEEYEESISKRVQFLNVLAEHTEDDFDADLIRNRMAKLSGGFAVVEVGGHTESEMKERRARIEDCLGAIRSAIEGGVCYGGGSTYFQVARLLYQKEPLAENETIWYKLGWRTLARALEAPLLKLLDNSERGRSASRSAIFSREGEWFSWDAVEGTLRDFRKPPWILDPYELLVTSLKSAVSVATVLLTVEGAIHDSD